MAQIERWYEQDLKKPVQVQAIGGNVFSLDNNGTLIGVRVYDNGEAAELSGSVTAYCTLADGQTVSVAGTREENRVYFSMPQSALAVPGTIKIVVKLTEDTTITTLAALIGTVYRSRSDTIITPSSQVITDWSQQIAAEIQNCVDARTSLAGIIAAAYSTSSAYAVGAYCQMDGKLYRCTTAITSGESWTAGHWTEVKLGNDVNDLKSALNLNGILVEQGNLNSDGTWKNIPTRIVTGFLKFTSSITLTAEEGYEFSYFAYNSDFSIRATSSWLTTKSITATQYYYRLIIKKEVSTDTISPSEFSSAFSNSFSTCQCLMTQSVADERIAAVNTGIKDANRGIAHLEDKKQDRVKTYTPLTGTKKDDYLWNGSTGQESSQSNYAYKTVSSGFTAGDYYAFTGYKASNSVFSGVVFYDSNMTRLGWYNPETAPTPFTHVILLVPEGTASIYINGRETGDNQPEMYSIGYSDVDLSEAVNTISDNQYGMTNWMDRRYQDGEYEQYEQRTGLDHLVVTFSVDDSHADISDIATAFINAELPLCLATIPEKLNDICNDGNTVLANCLRVQNAGGEILTHNQFTIGASTTPANYKKYFVGSKKKLTDSGLIVNGIIKAGGGTDDPDIKVCKTYLRSYYDYGTGFQYINDRRYNNGRAAIKPNSGESVSDMIARIKASIDSAASGGIRNFYSHGLTELGENWVSIIMEIAEYVLTKPNAEIVTIGEMFTGNFVKSFKD